jgi:hypothetical protein
VEVKIGVIHANRELTLDSSQTADEVHKAIAAALGGDTGLLELRDDTGRTIFVPVEKLAYVEVAGESVRRVGFGAL